MRPPLGIKITRVPLSFSLRSAGARSASALVVVARLHSQSRRTRGWRGRPLASNAFMRWLRGLMTKTLTKCECVNANKRHS